jgi:hypothetical protein
MSSGRALTDDFPVRLWTVSDDTLSTSLGAIIDAGVDTSGVVYLLDRQACVVHRIDENGAELSALGRQGEGPGEFNYPSLLAVFPSGGCVVISDFNAPMVCFTPEGNLCEGLDLSLIRNRFVRTRFLATARIDIAGSLFVVASTDIAYGADSAPPHALSVFRLTRGAVSPVVLFTTNKEIGNSLTVIVPKHSGPYIPRCWDVDADGRIIYAEPSGKYSVVIGHPVDGESNTVDLPVAETDSVDLSRVAESMGRSVSELPRIVDIHWIGADRFLVKPAATVVGSRFTQGGIVEVFDTEGDSYGRYTLYDDIDGSYDSLFLRNGCMVIVEGGWSARRASVGIKSAQSEGIDSDAIRVHLYDLRIN